MASARELELVFYEPLAQLVTHIVRAYRSTPANVPNAESKQALCS